MITAAEDVGSQSAASATPHQRVPPHFCFQRQIASLTRLMGNTQSHLSSPQEQGNSSIAACQPPTAQQPLEELAAESYWDPASVYQPQSGYPQTFPTQMANSTHPVTVQPVQSLHTQHMITQTSYPQRLAGQHDHVAAAATLYLPQGISSSSNDWPHDDKAGASSQQQAYSSQAQLSVLRPPQCSRLAGQLQHSSGLHDSQAGADCDDAAAAKVAAADQMMHQTDINALLNNAPCHAYGQHESHSDATTGRFICRQN